MKVGFINSIKQVKKFDWNTVVANASPFLRYEFLSAMESHDCVGEAQGWIPYHMTLSRDDNNELLAVMPLYLKYNSYGELVFDWSWADAYERAGRRYYPKLVSAIPYTPAPGNRLCVKPSEDENVLRKLMLEKLIEEAKTLALSSIHCLFPTSEECNLAETHNFFPRIGCQFHWQNKNYESFSEFLSQLNNRKRKNIKKERKSVLDQGIQYQILNGNEIEEDLWPVIYQFYQITFLEKGGLATFTLAFFKEIAKTMGAQLVVILAIYQGEYVAGAICYQDDKTLWGRHWGALKKFENLHFELCYYQGIELAIKQGLTRFEPGAQGEYKLSRGFLPQQTLSFHWIKDDDFSQAIRQFTVKETAYMAEYISEMSMHSPFKKMN